MLLCCLQRFIILWKEGNLTKKVDTETGSGVNYEYDSLGRLIHSAQFTGSTDDGRDMASATTLQRTEHLYDTANRISTQSWQLGRNVYSETYTYDKDNGVLTLVAGNLFDDYAYTYDALHRVKSKYCWRYTQTYSYRGYTDSAGTARTTTQVSRIDYTAGTSEQAFSDFSLAYTYDQRGNITQVEGTGITGHDAQYTYDVQSQLTSETVNGVTYNYAYDTYGNIRSVSGGESHTYTYGNEEWRDLLTAYDGHSISYDEIGNPETYYNGTDWEFEWQKGRQLASATSGNTTASYTYDLNGIRSSKTVTTADGTVTYNFLTQNGKVVRQEWNGNFMDFIYDNAGRPYAIVNGNATEQALYYYVLNQQGDVIRILGPNDTVAATYTYNAWGEVISATGWMANQNPIRYRGYFQDNETGFYYCQSRYYDPSIGRFINADQFASTGQDFVGYNMFAYCNNNPIVNIDSDGKAVETVLDVISLAVSAVEVASNPTDYSAWVGLIGDTVDLIPFVTGVGETIRALKTADKLVDGADTIIDSYRRLKKGATAVGEEVHHIVEKRFGQLFGYGKYGSSMPSIALSAAEHRKYTNLWRLYIPYGSKDVSIRQIIEAAAKIYSDDPRLMGAVIYTMIKNAK